MQPTQGIPIDHALEQVFQALDAGVRLVAPDRTVLLANGRFATLCGTREQDLVGRPCHDALACPLCHTPRCPIARDLSPGESVNEDVLAERSDGRSVPCHLSASPWIGPDGTPAGVSDIVRDVTPLHRAQAKLRQYADELERKNRRLAEATDSAHRFVDTVAHEFRTPLRVIGEFGEVLREDLAAQGRPRPLRYVDHLCRAADDLSRMVDDLLDTSRLRAASVAIDRRAVRLGELIDRTWDLLSVKATEKGIALRRELDGEADLVFADPDKLTRCLVNLAINAVKFSRPDSTVTLATRARPGAVELSVGDQGPGLTGEERQRIFRRFAQLRPGVAGAQRGFGLGLSIVREMASANFAAVEVDSAPGQGSTFRLRLPTCGAASIVQHACATLARAAEPDDVVVALTVTTVDARGRPRRDPPTDLPWRATDLLLPTGEPSRWLAAGLSRPPYAPERWTARLLGETDDRADQTDPRADGDPTRTGPHAAPPAQIDEVGQWPVDDLDALRAALIARAVDPPTPAPR